MRQFTTKHKKVIILLCVVLFAITLMASIYAYKAHKQGQADEQTPIVYITHTGECFHNENCYTLRYSKKIPIRQAKAERKGYRPCSKCMGGRAGGRMTTQRVIQRRFNPRVIQQRYNPRMIQRRYNPRTGEPM